MRHRVNSLIGIPWERGGRDPARGLDCLGLLIYLGECNGTPIEDPWEAAQQALAAGETTEGVIRKRWQEVKWDELRAGDIIFTGSKRGDHLVIVGENGYAITTGKGRPSRPEPLSKFRTITRSCWRVFPDD